MLKVGGEEFVCNGTLAQDNVVKATVNGKKEKYSVVNKDDEVFIFTKVCLFVYVQVYTGMVRDYEFICY